MTGGVDPALVREALAYGRGLLIQDGDLVLDAGRLVEVAGRANLEQALLLRISTPWADDRLNTGYGLDATEAFTAGLPRSLVKEVLRLNLIRTLAGDPRVVAVDQVLFDDDPAYLAAYPQTAGARQAGDRRVSLAEITIQPVPVDPAPGSAIGAAALAAAASMATAGPGPGAITLLADVRL